MNTTRQARFAGRFYPQEADLLKSNIKQYLDQVNQQLNRSNSPKIIIVPHAGYEFSAKTAAYAYDLIKPKNFTKVILLGVSHSYDLKGKIALSTKQKWQTPLGQILVNTQINQKIGENELFVYEDKAHLVEHSIEVQLPFLQVVLDQFTIVPMLFNNYDSEKAKTIIQVFSQILDDQTLIIVSSDLSHYPDLKNATIVDQKTLKAIISLDLTQLENTVQRNMSQQIPNLYTCACGLDSIKLVMQLANHKNYTHAQLLNYSTSASSKFGQADQVVGYASIVIY